MGYKGDLEGFQNNAEFNQQWGETLRGIRNSKRVSIQELSNRTGLSVKTITSIEHGKIAITMNYLHIMAEGLGMQLLVDISPKR
jgi:transcriptional regulator with XRE-family HTH domain